MLAGQEAEDQGVGQAAAGLGERAPDLAGPTGGVKVRHRGAVGADDPGAGVAPGAAGRGGDGGPQHGTTDDLVPAAQSVRLAEALRQAGASVELDLVPGATHFWKGASDVAAIISRSVEFLRAQA